MGLFSKIFGGKPGPPTAPEPPPSSEPSDPPAVVVILRRGMSVPSSEYIEQVVGKELGPLPASVPRVGLSQPSWFKTEEVADAIASSAVEALGKKFAIEEPSHRRRIVEGPDGCPVMLVELRRS